MKKSGSRLGNILVGSSCFLLDITEFDYVNSLNISLYLYLKTKKINRVPSNKLQEHCEILMFPVLSYSK